MRNMDQEDLGKAKGKQKKRHSDWKKIMEDNLKFGEDCYDSSGEFALTKAKLDSIMSVHNWDQGFQSDARLATILYHLNSGHYRFDEWKEHSSDYCNETVDVDAMKDEILAERLTDEELFERMEHFFNVHSYSEGDLFACGACGWRQMEREKKPTIKYEKIALTDPRLQPLMMTEEQQHEFTQLKAKGGIEVPLEMGADKTTLEPWKVASVVPVPTCPGNEAGDKCMHLHPEAVETDNDFSLHTRICPVCMDYLNGKKRGGNKIPPMSVAAGVDFGCYRRAGLPELTLHEELILARVRLYFASVKLTSNTGDKVNQNTRSAVKGNAILFQHDSLEVVSKIIDKEVLKKQLHLHMVDPSKNSDEMMKKMLKTTTLLARPWVLFQWIAVLREVNPYYKDIMLNLEWDKMRKEIESLNKEIVDSADIIADHHAVHWEKALGSDVGKSHYVEKSGGDTNSVDVAPSTQEDRDQSTNIAESSSMETASGDGKGMLSIDKHGTNADKPLPLRCSVLMDLPGTSGDNGTFADKCVAAVGNLVLQSTGGGAGTYLGPDGGTSQKDEEEDGVDTDSRGGDRDKTIADEAEGNMMIVNLHEVHALSGNGNEEGPDEVDALSGHGDEEGEEMDPDDSGSLEQLPNENQRGGDLLPLSDLDIQGMFVEQKLAESQRKKHPCNEIDDGEKLLAMAFPSVFLLGKSYKRGAAKLTKAQRNHMLHQHTKVPERNRMLLAYLYNSRQRFEVNMGVTAHVAENPKSVLIIQEMLTNPKVKEAFENLKKDPNSPRTKSAAKSLARKYSPLLRFSGRNVSYGAVECYGLKSCVMEMCKRFGLPSSFFTFSFSDSDNPRSNRASYHTVNNKKFPACFEEGGVHGDNGLDFMMKLKAASTLQSEGALPVHESHTPDARARASMSNPVTYVSESKSLIFDVLEILLGKPPENFAGRWEGTSRRKTRYFGFDKGVNGHCIAYIGVPEDHAKGTIHYHILFFGGLPPYALQKFAKIEELIPSIASVLDSVYKSQLPTPVLVSKLFTDIVQKPGSVFRRGVDNQKPAIPEPCRVPLLTRHRSPQFCIPIPEEHGEEKGVMNKFLFYDSVVEATNSQASIQMWHNHMRTCHKGLFGQSGCRLCMKAGIAEKTEPVELWLQSSENEEERQNKSEGTADAATVIARTGATGTIDPVSMESDSGARLEELLKSQLAKANPQLDFSNVEVDEFRTESIHYVRLRPPPKPKSPETYGQTTGGARFLKPGITTDRVCIWESARPPTSDLAELFCPKLQSEDLSIEAETTAATPHNSSTPALPAAEVITNKAELLESLQKCLNKVEGFDSKSPIWKWLDNLPDRRLANLFQQLSKSLQDSNGNIATYNPVLAFLTGSHNNCQILGGQDQALGAVFYICPYIAKRKAPLEESMSLLNNCFQLAEKYPTVLEDEKDSPVRFAKQVLQKTLNKMNLTMELSDWQISAANVGLPSIISSEVFVHRKTSGDIGYREHITMADDPEAAREKLVQAETKWYTSPAHQRNSNTELYGAGEVDGAFEWEQMKAEHQMEGGESLDGSHLPESVDGHEDIHQHGEDDHSTESTVKPEASTTTEPVVDAVPPEPDVAKVSIEEPSPFIGNISVYRVVVPGEDQEEAPILVPDAELYNNRGKALNFLSRHEYRSIIRIEKEKPQRKSPATANSATRKVRMARYPFHPTFALHGEYVQVVMAKQPTTILHDPWPKHPDNPENPADKQDPESEWSKKADRYASFILTEYRPETCNYGDVATAVNYDCHYSALVNWVKVCMDSSCMMDKFRLSSVDRRCTALTGSPFSVKQMALAYRGRNRTLWTVQQQQDYCRSEYLDKLQKEENENLMDQSKYEEKFQELSETMNKNMALQNSHDGKMRQTFLIATGCSIPEETVPDRRRLPAGDVGTTNSHTECIVESPFAADRYYPDAATKTAMETAAKADVDFADMTAFEQHTALRLSQSTLARKLDRTDDSAIVNDDDPNATEEINNDGIHSVLNESIVLATTKERAIQDARAGLNKKQTEIFDMYCQYFQNGFRGELVPNVMLIHGMGGTGKTEGITRLESVASFFGVKILSTAFNCINALMFPDGRTTASLIDITNQTSFMDLSFEQKTELEKLLKNVKLIFIDETGNQAPFHLAQLSHICQQALQNANEPFGGIPVVLSGDFGQLGPVKAGDPLPKAVMNLLLRHQESQSTKKPARHRKGSLLQASKKNNEYEPDHPYTVGARLFQSAEFLEMTEQMRSEDSEHTKVVEGMYYGKDVKLEPMIKIYKALHPSDFEEDPIGWAEAPIIVRSNRERLSLTHDKAVHLAKLKNTVVIRWLTKHKHWAQKPAPEYQDQAKRNDPCFFEYFVVEAPCYFNANVSKKLRLVNGLKTRYHSIVMKDEESNQWLQNEIAEAQPGTVITLPFMDGVISVPAAVTVSVEVPAHKTKLLKRFRHLFEEEVHDDDAPAVPHQNHNNDKSEQGSVHEGKEDPPLPPSKFLVPVTPQVGRDYLRCTVRGGNGYRASRIKVRPRFPLEPGFAITVNKAQGQTMDKVILALSYRPLSAMMQFSYSGLYVALSRVRKSSDIRLLLPGNTHTEQFSGLLYLTDLKADPYHLSVIQGFRQGALVHHGNGNSTRRRWNRQAAYSKLVGLDQQNWK